jgi:hypothetical protein
MTANEKIAWFLHRVANSPIELSNEKMHIQLSEYSKFADHLMKFHVCYCELTDAPFFGDTPESFCELCSKKG